MARSRQYIHTARAVYIWPMVMSTPAPPKAAKPSVPPVAPTWTGGDSEWRLISAAAIVGAVCTLFYALSPVLLGKLSDVQGLAMNQLGWIAGLNMLGLFIPNIMGPAWINRVNIRTTAMIASAMGVVFYALIAFATSFPAFAAIAFLVGLSTGAAYGISLAVLGRTKNPDRGFAIAFCLQVVLAMALTFFLTRLSIKGSFSLLAIMMCMSVIAAGLIPSTLSRTNASKTNETFVSKPSLRNTLNAPILLGLGAIVLVLVGESALWAFLERIAVDRGLGSDAGATGVFVSLLAAAAGSALAAILAVKYGRLKPMMLATILSLLSLVVFAGFGGNIAYLLAAIIYGAAWNFGSAYRMGLIASVDSHGSWTTQIPAMQMLGAILGPIIAGQLVTHSGFGAVYVFSGVVWVLGFILFVAAIIAAKSTTLFVQEKGVGHETN